METPDQRLFEEDILSAEFRAGVLKGFWDVAAAEALPPALVWPARILWLAAAARPNAPEHFYIQIDVAGYRTVAPTGTFWDPDTNSVLDLTKRPKGKPESRCAKVFRTDWKGGAAFYHPYDRVATSDHPQWKTDQPNKIWTSAHTIVDYLDEFHSLLNGGEYIGV
jgi:hypothetical protein